MNMAPKLPLPTKTGSKAAASQKGVTLIVGLIMLMMITMLVVGAFTLSSTNLTAVGNMQVREEAVAAANHAIEGLISGNNNFYVATGKQSRMVDIDKNGIIDYTVEIEKPRCVRLVEAPLPLIGGTGSGSPGPSSVDSGIDSNASPSSNAIWNTDWDINATVTDVASGSSIRVRQGVRIQFKFNTEDDKKLCLDAV